ncbi:MAG: hypothetical protein J0G35_11900 [Acidobacteriales bacterium]|nr:hypothetical protein [Terriglobales bacterium]
METKSLLEAIAKHMDLLESITDWTFFFSLAVGWAGLQGKEVTGLGMTFSRNQAFRAACSIYMAGSLVVLFLLWRLGSLLTLIDANSVPEAATRLATDSWLMNPFSFFGPHPFYNSIGYGCLIFLWWVCTASLSTLTDGLLARSNIVLLSFFLFVGGLVILAVNRVGHIVQSTKSSKIDVAFYDSFWPSGWERVIAPVVGAVLGILAFAVLSFWVLRSRRKVGRST